MADVILNNYSDDSKIKRYIQQELMPRVFHDIPLNALNTGAFSIINEYISQATEQMAFTSSFYFNENFITKAVLPESIYAEAAIFNIGYAFATPSSTNILLELKLSDLFAITQNSENKNANGLYEFILDKNTLINMKDGQTYSLDYDISFQYMSPETASDTRNGSWIVQYLNDEPNSISINKNKFISYRVTDNWLCLFVKASEYTRTTKTVINNMTNGVPNADTIINCNDHICGFDVVYVEPSTKYGESDKRIPIRTDHILPIHATVNDKLPYVHYIMDNTQTIRLMWQIQGNRAFVPKLNSRYEITVYTCHGKSANFTEAPDEQPNVVTASNRFKNNANVMKAAFIISGSMGGTDIGTAEHVRRKTIEAYNTANVISTDHDIEEWFKTFYFDHILFPFFFKRRDDPWGRIWSGFLALTDSNNEVYRTNTLHGHVTYEALYSNNNNNVSSNEIIIPPGWVWTYGKDSTNLYKVYPYTKNGSRIVETAKTLTSVDAKFVFANPFGIRIQKQPFAIGYFNPWINESLTTSRVPSNNTYIEDVSQIYHATPLTINIKRTYRDDKYHISFWLDISQLSMNDGSKWIQNMRNIAVSPIINEALLSYFKMPSDLYANQIPMLALQAYEQWVPFNPRETYVCVRERNLRDDGTWNLSDIWIQDNSISGEPKRISIDIMNNNGIYGKDNIWNNMDILEPVYVTGDVTITCEGLPNDDVVSFMREGTNDYYIMQVKKDLQIKDTTGTLRPARINRIKYTVSSQNKTERTKYGEESLYQIGGTSENVALNVRYEYIFIDVADSEVGVIQRNYVIVNAANVYIPYPSDGAPEEVDGMWVFTIPVHETTAGVPEETIIVYADMKPSPQSASIDYYRIPFIAIDGQTPFFYVRNNTLDLSKNNLRVVLHAYMNGGETGYVEMYPVKRDEDGTYLFETDLCPTNELVDVDNRIHIASVDYNGGSWKPTTEGSVVNIDATDPKLRISVLFKSKTNPDAPSVINNDPTYTGYYMNDEFEFDKFSLIQELKEMRSVVNFAEDSTPSFDQYKAREALISWNGPNTNHVTWYDINKIAEKQAISKVHLTEDERYQLRVMSNAFVDNGYITALETMRDLLSLSDNVDPYKTYRKMYVGTLNKFVSNDDFIELFTYTDNNVQQVWEHNGEYYTNSSFRDKLIPVEGKYYMVKDDVNGYRNLKFVIWSETYNNYVDVSDKVVMWTQVCEMLSNYTNDLDALYEYAGVSLVGEVEIQLMPFVEYSLMNSDKFEDFVATFTQVHKAIEPVIFKRLEGNNYLDCKLLATYGKPHTYCSDLQYQLSSNAFWPDLNIQISFNVKLYNKALTSNTISELKIMIKAYFNRLTTVHTPLDLLSMNNNIYVSHLIQQMEAHSNVAYLKFNGWYTNQKNDPYGNYMDSNTQAIIQKWKRLEDMPTDELTRFVPEMFVLEDRNIDINVLDDNTLA